MVKQFRKIWIYGYIKNSFKFKIKIIKFGYITYRITLVLYFYNFTDKNYNRNISNIRTSTHQERNFSINLSKRKGKMHPFRGCFTSNLKRRTRIQPPRSRFHSSCHLLVSSSHCQSFLQAI